MKTIDERVAVTGFDVPALARLTNATVADWDAYQTARRELIPNLSLSNLLACYRATLERDFS